MTLFATDGCVQFMVGWPRDARFLSLRTVHVGDADWVALPELLITMVKSYDIRQEKHWGHATQLPLDKRNYWRAKGAMCYASALYDALPPGSEMRDRIMCNFKTLYARTDIIEEIFQCMQPFLVSAALPMIRKEEVVPLAVMAKVLHVKEPPSPSLSSGVVPAQWLAAMVDSLSPSSNSNWLPAVQWIAAAMVAYDPDPDRTRQAMHSAIPFMTKNPDAWQAILESIDNI